MADLDNGWNLIKLHGGRSDPNDGGGDESMTSKSHLSIDVVSDEFNVDDDILSNTSSDDYAELTSSLRFKKAGDQERYVEDSPDTLTGSRTSQIDQDSRSGGPLTRRRMSRLLADKFGSNKKSDDNSAGVSNSGRPGMFSNINLNVWQVVALSSLVSMLIFMGIQAYSSSILNGLERFGASKSPISAPTSDGSVYGGINFLDHEEAQVLSTWKPRGKYYVDFDKRIAYPIQEHDLLGWRRYKTEMNILWHTSRAKLLKFWKLDVVPSSRNVYERIEAFIQRSIAWDIQWAKACYRRSRNAFVDCWKSIFPRVSNLNTVICKKYKAVSSNLSRNCLVGFQLLKNRLYTTLRSTKGSLTRFFDWKSLKQKRAYLNKSVRQMLLKWGNTSVQIQKTVKKTKRFLFRKYRRKVLPRLNKLVKRSSKVTKNTWEKVSASLRQEYIMICQHFDERRRRDGLFEQLAKRLAQGALKFDLLFNQHLRDFGLHKRNLEKGFLNMKNVATKVWYKYTTG